MAEQSTVRAAVCLLCVLLTTMAFGWLASRVLTLERMVMQSGCLAPAREKETTVSPDTVTRTHQEMPKDLSPWSLQASMMGSTPSTMLRRHKGDLGQDIMLNRNNVHNRRTKRDSKLDQEMCCRKGNSGEKGQRGHKGIYGPPGFPGPRGTVGDRGFRGQKGQKGDTAGGTVPNPTRGCMIHLNATQHKIESGAKMSWNRDAGIRPNQSCLRLEEDSQTVGVGRAGFYYVYCSVAFFQVTPDTVIDYVGFKITKDRPSEGTGAITEVLLPINRTLLREEIQGHYSFSHTGFTGRLVDLAKGHKIAVVASTGALITPRPFLSYFGMYMVSPKPDHIS